MLEQLGIVEYHECRGKYLKVRRLVEQATHDPHVQTQIYQLLFRNGGRCDCTVDRNVVRDPHKLAEVEAGIGRVLAL